jgi:hypothetical protein
MVKVHIGKCLYDICPIVFGVKKKDGSSVFALNCAAVCGIKEAAAKEEGLEFNASKGVVGVALIYNQHRTVLEVRIA